MKKFLKNWIWQLPQNLLGVLWRTVKKDSIIASVSTDDSVAVSADVYLMKAGGGVTLGKYIFISQTYENQETVIRHECGHVRQSEILGPLYLIVIGIPSLVHAALNGYTHCCENSSEGYYHFYTEHILMGEYDVRNSGTDVEEVSENTETVSDNTEETMETGTGETSENTEETSEVKE